ncbi:MAG TPA: hypothetical protein VFF04_04115 [Candidatus Babeliales bacterium]|nr:hypothetical protein [Candidatus Babeliales bacterium]
MSLPNKLSKNVIGAGIGYAGIKFASLVKISFIVGSVMAFFSGTSVAIPLIGAFTGLFGTVAVFCLRLSFHTLVNGSFALSYLAYHIPGLCASAYWASESKLIRLILPAVCMIAFMVHPIGGQAFVYSLYWLIPIALYFVSRKTVFMHAISSTFIAHAVGSVLWLYSVPMTAQQWLSLIPVVAIERMLIATSMAVAYHAISYTRNHHKQMISTLFTYIIPAHANQR